MEDTIFNRATFLDVEEIMFNFDHFGEDGQHPCTDAPQYGEEKYNQAIPQDFGIGEQLVSYDSYNPRSRDIIQEETIPARHRDASPCDEGVANYVSQQRAALTRCLDKFDSFQQDSNTAMSTENSSYVASPSTNDNEETMSVMFGTPSGKKSKSDYPKWAPGLIASGVQISIYECFNGSQEGKHHYMINHLSSIIQNEEERDEFLSLMLGWDSNKNDWASVGRNLKKFGPVYASALVSCVGVFLTEGGQDFESWLFNTDISDQDKCSIFMCKEKLAEAFWKKFKI